MNVIISHPMALRALEQYLRTHPCPLQPGSPFFALRDRSPLCRRTMIAATRTVLHAIGEDESKYAGHSFRRGGASSLAACNTPRHLIKTLGRWKSESYQLYIELPEHAIAQAARSI